MTAKNAKQYLCEEVIPALRERSPYFDIASIRQLLINKKVHIERKTLNRYLRELKIEDALKLIQQLKNVLSHKDVV